MISRSVKMKKILCIILIIIAATLNLSCRKLNPIIPRDVNCVPCENKYIFKDAAVKQAVSVALGKVNCDVCVADLSYVTLLSINSQVQDFSDFQLLSNLKELSFTDITIPNFDFVSGMPLMVTMTVTGGTVESMEGIGGAVALKNISINNAKVTDITPLTATALANMDSLTLIGNHITSLTPISGMTALTYLNVASNYLITSLDGIENMTNLVVLDASVNTINDISAIASLVNLKVVRLSTNNITDLSDLAGLLNVTELRLDYNFGVSDISVLQQLTKLSRLTLANDNITGLAPVINNSGIGMGDWVWIGNNPGLDNNTDICALKCKLGVVGADCTSCNWSICTSYSCP
jgi:Leucine-rich repeat (LRR) protein